MDPATRSSNVASDPLIVSLDVGTSSVRSLLFDSQAHHLKDYGTQLPYRITTTHDGGVEADPALLLDLSCKALDEMHRELSDAKLKPAAVSFSAFWHSFLGVGADGNPTTPIVHLFDTRSGKQVEELKKRLDPEATHQRTGCVIHTSYWPAKLLWLSQERQEAFDRTQHWMSFGEFLYFKLFGEASLSSSMASGSGIWNQNRNDYDEDTLAALPVKRETLASRDQLDQPRTKLRDEFRQRWPLFDGIPWFPALGDGACNNIGSGCITKDRFALMVGTSGAMRAVLEQDSVAIPPGVWCYRVDAQRFVLGGALSNGGEVFAWLKRNFVLPANEELDKQIGEIVPGSHGLSVLPLFAGERSPNWRADARGAIAGMSLATTPIEITRAALEAVALRFRQIYEIMAPQVGAPKEIVASGGALANSPAWSQMMSDALQRSILFCKEQEASSRGAALLALESIKAIGNIADLPPEMGHTVEPRTEYAEAFNKIYAAQMKLYRKLVQEN